jgi:hypothetical protein
MYTSKRVTPTTSRSSASGSSGSSSSGRSHPSSSSPNDSPTSSLKSNIRKLSVTEDGVRTSPTTNGIRIKTKLSVNANGLNSPVKKISKKAAIQSPTSGSNAAPIRRTSATIVPAPLSIVQTAQQIHSQQQQQSTLNSNSNPHHGSPIASASPTARRLKNMKLPTSPVNSSSPNSQLRKPSIPRKLDASYEDETTSTGIDLSKPQAPVLFSPTFTRTNSQEELKKLEDSVAARKVSQVTSTSTKVPIRSVKVSSTTKSSSTSNYAAVEQSRHMDEHQVNAHQGHATHAIAVAANANEAQAELAEGKQIYKQTSTKMKHIQVINVPNLRHLFMFSCFSAMCPCLLAFAVVFVR